VTEQNLVWNNMAVHPTWKKEKNSAERDGFLYASLLPPSCQKQRKCILQHCVQDELEKIKNFFVRNEKSIIF